MSTMMDDVPLLLSTLMDRGAYVQPTNTIVTATANGYHEQTYAEHQSVSVRLAAALQRTGVQRGQRVATFMWNNARHFSCYHAIPCMGAVLHTLNIRLSADQLGFIIRHGTTLLLLWLTVLLFTLVASDAVVNLVAHRA
jgi:fatty-acyl-CoA synthase